MPADSSGDQVPYLLNSRTPPDTAETSVIQRKSPAVATLLSLALPGAGQAYNESYWKVPVVLGLGVYLGSQWLDAHRRYRDFRNKYSESLNTSPSGNPTYLNAREFYREERDTFTWYLAILYFANVLDAYVDASLYEFSVGDDLAVRLIPGAGARLSLRVGF
jgi:hypothetical protein